VMKLFPLYLLLYPVWRFDRRMLIGATAGVLAAVLIPVAVMGPTASVAAYREFIFDRMTGEAAGRGDPSVTSELHRTNVKIESFEYMAYNTLHPVRADRAKTVPSVFFPVHLAISAVVTAIALWLMRRRGDPVAEFLYFAALVEIAIPILPVSRPHYFLLGAIPLMGLLAVEWPRNKGLWPGRPLAMLIGLTMVISLLVELDQPQVVDFGLITYAGLALAVMALLAGHRRALAADQAAPDPTP
jgi:hypothetical protein